MSARWLPPLLLLSALTGCFGHPTHPVTAAPAVPAGDTAPRKDGGEPTAPSGADALRSLFLGLADMEAPLRVLRRRAAPPGTVPQLIELPHVERAVVRRFQGQGPLGPLRHVAAFGFSGSSPLPPRAMADLLVDPAVERRATTANRFDVVGTEFDLPGLERHHYRVEMLRRGKGPFRYDFRFTTVLERWDLEDGRVLMRFDVLTDPPPENVALYRGATVIEPEGQGSQVTEVLILGTSLSVPFFMTGLLRDLSLDVFRRRIGILWELAHERASKLGR